MDGNKPPIVVELCHIELHDNSLNFLAVSVSARPNHLNRATSSIVDKNATIGDYGVPISGCHELVSHGLHDAIDLFIRHKPPGKIGLLTVQKKGPPPKPEKAVRSIWVVAIHGRYSIGDVNIKKPIP